MLYCGYAFPAAENRVRRGYGIQKNSRGVGMDSKQIQNTVSKSLLTRDVYGICFTERESLDCTGDDFFALRRQFLSNARRSVKISQRRIMTGVPGVLKGRMARRSLMWKKVQGRVVTEECARVSSGTVLIRRNFDTIILSKIFFDKNQQWLKSEYFQPSDAITPQVILKPNEIADQIERFDYNAKTGRYVSTMLEPAPYDADSAAQRVIDHRLGRPAVLVWLKEGERCYVPREEAQKRIEMHEQNQEKDAQEIVRWGVEEEPAPVQEPTVSFSGLDVPAVIEPAEKPVQEKEEPQESAESVQTEKEPEVTDTEAIWPQDFDSPEEPTGTGEEQSGEVSPAAAFDKQARAEQKPEETAGQETTAIPAQTEQKQETTAVLTDSAGKLPAEAEPEAETAAVVAEQGLSESTEPGQSVEITGEKSTAMPDEAADKPEPPCEKESVQAAEQMTVLEKQLAEFVEGVNRKLHAPLETEAAIHRRPQSREAVYRAAVIDGKIAGLSGVKRGGALPTYEGETLNGKRHGFGVSYSDDGRLAYAGFWENDKKSGLGISFRESDHAVHVAQWAENQPDSFISLFDAKGNLQYSGTVEDGRKNGIGISYRLEDGSIFVGKWEKGKPTGFGSVFDRQGHLIYTGMWQNGRRNGTGSEFNKRGEVVFTGEWKDDRHYNGVLYKRPSGPDSE